MKNWLFIFLCFVVANVSAQADSVKASIADSSKHMEAQFKDVVITDSSGDPSIAIIYPVATQREDILTAKDIQRNPVSNVFDALTNSTGLYCDIDQGMTNPVDININGLEGNYTLYCIDGVPAMNNLAGIFALGAFPVSMIDYVEILRGSYSTKPGNGAMAGVINILTKDPDRAPTLALDEQFNSKLESTLGLTMAFRLKKVHTLLSVAADNMNHRWDMNHDNFMDIPLINRVSFFNKWKFVRKDNRTALIYARYLFEDRFTGEMNTPGRLVGSNQYFTQWLRTNQWQTGFIYDLPVQEHFTFRVDYSEHYQQAWFDTSHYNGTLRNLYSLLQWDKCIENHCLRAGADYHLKYYSDNTGLSNPALTGIAPYVHTAGAFVEDYVSINHYNQLMYGIRFDYSNASGPVATPIFNYTWHHKQQDIIRLALGTGYRLPDVLNEGFTALETSRQVIVPQKLKTEYSVSMNLDYTRNQTFDAGTLKFDGGIFGIYLTNFVEPDYETNPSAVIYNNSQGGGSFGANASLDWAFKFPLHLGFNCTYAFTFELDRDSGDIDIDIPTHAPPFTANFYLSYTYPETQITFDVTGDVISPMLLATVPGDFRPNQSPWFSIANIQVRKKFKNGFEVFAGVKNLFNFVQQNPILRPFDPFNRSVAVNNPNDYHFDTTYAYSTIEGIKGFVGFRYTLQ